jgi:MFS family permease
MAGTPPSGAATDVRGRPTRPLPMGHLARIAAYWLGLTAIDASVGLFIQNRVNFGGFVDDFSVGTALFLISVGGAVLGILIQPTVGSISDYTVSRWGRRKPYIVIGSVLDVFFLVAIAYSNSVLALAVFVLLLSFSTNIARGPFQGYVPDLVPGNQVGLASALVGLMQILGNVIGFALVPLSLVVGNMALALIAVAIIELVTMISVVYRVDSGPPATSRAGRSWVQVARETWATDILRERSYVWLVASRLFFLLGGSLLVNHVVSYLKQSHGLAEAEAGTAQLTLLGIVAVTNLVVIVPAARLSDRIGRKPVIYASCALGAVGIAIAGLSPNVPLALVGTALMAAASGMFLAVDWALMTDIIPKAAAGRYMGISNVATASSGLLATSIGGLIIDGVNRSAGVTGPGPRVAYLVGVVCFAIGALLLRPVVEPRRGVQAEAERSTA